MLYHKRQRAYGEMSRRRCGIRTFAGGLNMAQDEQIIPGQQSPRAYNVEFSDGALRRCSGLAAPVKYSDELGATAQIPALPEANCKLFLVRTMVGERLLAWGSNGFYTEDVSNGHLIWTPTACTAAHTGENDYCFYYQSGGVPKMILGNDQDGMFLLDPVIGTPSAVTNAKRLWAGTIHYERVFAVGELSSQNRVCFSQQYHPTNFTVAYDQGGYIDFLRNKGTAIAVISYADSVFVFWQYSIVRIKAYGYQEEFSAAEVYQCSSPILEGSVQVCGDYVIFATRDGVYAFNGAEAVCVSDLIVKLFQNSGDCLRETATVYFAGQYYLSGRMRLPGETAAEQLLLVFDLKSRKWRMFRNVAVRQFVALHNHGEDRLLMVLENGTLCMPDSTAQNFLGTPIQACWRMPVSDLDSPESEKEIRELHAAVSGNGTLRFTVFTENGSETVEATLQAARRVVSFPFRLRGRMVGLCIENVNGSDFCVSAPTLIFQTERGKTLHD